MKLDNRLALIGSRLELPLVRRAVGLLEGRHRSIYRGQGQDFDDLHLYVPGEDIGDIDWKSSARSGLPTIKRYIATSNLTTLLVVDTSRAMNGLAPSGETKSEVAAFAAGVMAYLARMRTDRVALVCGDKHTVKTLPGRASTGHIELVLQNLEDAAMEAAPEADLENLLDKAAVLFPRRALVVVITDEQRIGAPEEAALRRLRTRHDVLFFTIADADPFDFEEGQTTVDIITGEVIHPYLRNRKKLQAELEEVRNRRRADLKVLLRSLQTEGISVSGTEDLLRQLVDVLGRLRRAGRN